MSPFFWACALVLSPISSFNRFQGSSCYCDSSKCPELGLNTLTMGNGGSVANYTYVLHNTTIVVANASAHVTFASLNHGTDTVQCVRDYVRAMDDDGIKDCDAGHILANRLGGYGDEPLNLFPQDLHVNRGPFADFEAMIYECLFYNPDDTARLDWNFIYDNDTRTKPQFVNYTAQFSGKNCTTITKLFTNGD